MATTETLLREIDRYQDAFAAFERAAEAKGQAWLRPLRRAALARFVKLGFPTLKDEDWRFTSVSPIARTPFELPPPAQAETSREALRPFGFPGLGGHQLVFVNGRFAPGLSQCALLPKGVVVDSLAHAISEHRDLVEPHLARYADGEQDAFGALNTAFMEDGGFVRIPRGTVLAEPIHLLYVATATGRPTVTYPRNLVVVEAECEAAILEDYVSLCDETYFSNAVTEVVVGENSVVSHYLIERESLQAYNVSTLRVQQGRNSNVSSHSILQGGFLVRNNVHPVMAGEGGECLINGLFMPAGRQHMDNYMKVEHASPHCSSRQFYKGILDGHARGVFHGRIIVHKDAQKTDAKQTNMNLLLSEEAQINTKPQLEIYADDVKCTHGATIGQIDEDAIFYLRSRGITEGAARSLLLYAFASESLQRLKVEPVRKHLEGLIRTWLPLARTMEGGR